MKDIFMYPRQTRPEASLFSGCPSVRPMPVNVTSQKRLKGICSNLAQIPLKDSRMHQFDFGVQRLKVKVTVTSQGTFLTII